MDREMKEKYEMQLLEIRKLVSILNTWGNVLVNGNVHAQDRLQTLCNEIIEDGYTLDDIENEIQLFT